MVTWRQMCMQSKAVSESERIPSIMYNTPSNMLSGFQQRVASKTAWQNQMAALRQIKLTCGLV